MRLEVMHEWLHRNRPFFVLLVIMIMLALIANLIFWIVALA